MLRGLKRLARTAAVATVAMAVLSPAFAVDEVSNIIKYRRNVMKALGANITNIAAVAKGEVSFVENVVVNARGIDMLLGLAGDLFPEGSGEGDTHALPKIWENTDDFLAKLDTAREAAAAMVTAAETNDLGTIQAAIGDLGKACGGCHDTYREKQD